MRNLMFLEGEDIYLRPLTEQDAYGNYKYWFNDETVCKNNSHYRFPMVEEKLKQYIIVSNNSSDKIVLGIIYKDNNEHIGNISIQNINYFSRSAELAIIIGEKKYWGKGYAKEASVLLINHSFNAINLNRLYCGTYSNNVGMKKLANCLGFIQEGILREADFKQGSYIDIIKYGLLKKEWKL